MGVNSLHFYSDSFKLGGLMAMGSNKVETLVFSRNTTTILPSSPIHFPEMEDRSPLGKRTFNNVFQYSDPVIKYLGKSDAADSKATKTSSSVPGADSATFVEASDFSRYWRTVRNSLSDAPKASNTAFDPVKKVSQETMNMILSNNSISLFKIENGSQVVVRETQSTVTTDVPTQKSSNQDSNTVTLSKVDSQSPPRSSSSLSNSHWGLYD